MYAEIQKLRDDIFGSEADNSEAGYFGLWIGHAPVMRAGANAGMGKKEIFDDKGVGELGRLMAEFYYWNVIEAQGIALVNTAPWDKPLWDSRGSWFVAPSLRSFEDIAFAVAGTIVSTVVSAVATPAAGAVVGWAINMVDDTQYAMLDVVSGNKYADEAFFDLSKKAVITGTASLISGGFSSISSSIAASAASGVSRVAAQTAIAGAQAVTTSMATSVLGAVTYSHGAGFGFSTDSLNQSMKGGLVSALGGMTSTFTGGIMNIGLKGFTGDIYDNGTKLSGLVGGLAGGGVNYAFNEDFALNVLNLAGFTGGKYSQGLLEMHMGNGGISMNIGTGGVDASIGTVVSAAKGLEAWKVNAEIWTSKEEEAHKYTSQLRTLYSGNNVNRAEYEAILSGKTNVVEDRTMKETKSEFDGNAKTITLGSDALDDGSRFGLNVVFSHESYRNGLGDGVAGQDLETNRAVIGHIATATALMNTYGLGAIGVGRAAEAISYNRAFYAGNTTGILGILSNYDSSEDYWKLAYDGTLINDNQGYLRDENGKYINIDGTRTDKPIEGKTIGAKGIETGLLNILFGGTTDAKYDQFSDGQISIAQDLMIAAGMKYKEGTKGDVKSRSWGGNTKGQELNMNTVMANAGNMVADKVFSNYYNNTVDTAIAKSYGANILFEKNIAVPELAKARYDSFAANRLKSYGTAEEAIKQSLQSKYTQTVYDKQGNPVKTLRLSENNPVISDILKQNNAELNQTINKTGCNFMSVTGIVQMLTGKVFTSKQLLDIWNESGKTTVYKDTKVVDLSDASVNDANALANIALKAAGNYDFGIIIQRESTVSNKGTLAGLRMTVPYSGDSGGVHFVTGDKYSSIIYNPGWQLGGITRRDGIFVYAK
jgi:hypothetical protein